MACAGIPYQSFGDRAGALAVMTAWSRSPRGAIRLGHLGDLREHGAFPVLLGRVRAAARGRLELLGALLHRAPFLVGESPGRRAGRGARSWRASACRSWLVSFLVSLDGG